MNRIYLIILAVFFAVGCSDNKFTGEMGEILTEALEDCNLPTTEPVIVFTASWCSACTRLRNQFKSLNIEYHEIDAEDYAEEFVCSGGRYYPHLIVEGKKVNLRDREEVDLALKPYSDLLR